MIFNKTWPYKFCCAIHLLRKLILTCKPTAWLSVSKFQNFSNQDKLCTAFKSWVPAKITCNVVGLLNNLHESSIFLFFYFLYSQSCISNLTQEIVGQSALEFDNLTTGPRPISDKTVNSWLDKSSTLVNILSSQHFVMWISPQIWALYTVHFLWHFL